jgi:hypothetical protein
MDALLLINLVISTSSWIFGLFDSNSRVKKHSETVNPLLYTLYEGISLPDPGEARRSRLAAVWHKSKDRKGSPE